MRNTIVTCLAIICVAVLGALATFKGSDGTVILSSIAAVAGLGGYSVGKCLSQGKAQSKDSASKPDNPSSTS